MFAAKQVEPSEPSVAPKPSLLILFGSQTGTAEALAKKIANQAQATFATRVLDMNAFETVDWKNESRILFVTSTWGDGEPPDNAAAFWKFLNSETTPRMENISFSVLALGDRNYASFCGAGIRFDERLEQLGGKRIHPRAECDLDYESTAKAWAENVLNKLSNSDGASAAPTNEKIIELKNLSAAMPAASRSADTYSRQNPFAARLVGNRKLNATESAKDTRHLEISLEGSGLNYEVGDALGVVPRNSPALVEEILAALNFDGEEPVRNGGPSEIPLRKALLEHFEIRQIGTSLLEAVAVRASDSRLKELLEEKNKPARDQFLFGREVIDLLVANLDAKFSAKEFVSFLRKLNPRLYSIASSLKKHPGQVHLTVDAVRYETYGRKREGVCSTFLADRVGNDTPVPVFLQASHGFRLPANSETPIIMVGPGTGIAPFRAFIEEREAVGAKGKNWLFFGHQHAASDFFYRDELKRSQEQGFLKLTTAFSRDQAEKVYVQHRLVENAREVWSWLNEGAHFYVCGDASRMAKDVDAALHKIAETAGRLSSDNAAAYVSDLRKTKRYQRDVY